MDQARRARMTTKTWRVFGSVVLLVGIVALVVHPAPAGAAGSSPGSSGSSGSPGYWLAASDGGVYQFGTTNFGSMRGYALNQPIVGSAATTDGLGYWLVASDGGVFSFGDAKFHGSTGAIRLNQPIVGMAVDPATGGYWLVARDGGVFSFGAPFYGSTGAIRLNQPVVGMAVTPDGHGYWLVAADGGVFSFGDAKFHGSTGNIWLNKPVVGMAGTGSGGYWLVASDGGIFTFDAPFDGSTGNVNLVQPIVGMAVNGKGAGYWLTARDGGIFTFGNAPYRGSTGAAPGPAPVVSVMATTHGFPFPPGATGNDIAWPQCPINGGTIPSVGVAVPIVQVSNGSLNDIHPNPCFLAEARWAGANISAYILVDGLPSPAPVEARTGPAGTCNGNVNCESYNFGWYWARHWVAYSSSVGVNPSVWWLDVETAASWALGSAFTSSNAAVISGAFAGLRSSGKIAGVYSTAYQWGTIAGSLTLANVPLWVPGAGNISGPGNTATNFCSTPVGLYEPFAGGVVTVVQYGYGGNFVGAYTGPPSNYDQDYACG
jgi:hypothetical protein